MSDPKNAWRRRTVLTALAGLTASVWRQPAQAQAALPPVSSDDAIFTVSGKIKVHNQGDAALFDMKALDALPQTSFSTKTPWTPERKFSGVLLKTLMERLGGEGTTAVSYALNDYVIEIPLQNMTDDGPLLATRMDGALMPVQKFGPIFVVYRFDTHPEWRNNAIYSRCIWQLQKMVIR
ncbi:putative pterin-binding protein [Acidisoma sp. 7E03]